MNKDIEERVIRSKGLISAFACLLGLFCLINSVLTVYVNRVDTAGTAELRSGYMVRSLSERELWNQATDIFKYGDRADVRTEAANTELIADILKKTADEKGLTLKEISFYDRNGKHTRDYRSK